MRKSALLFVQRAERGKAKRRRVLKDSSAKLNKFCDDFKCSHQNEQKIRRWCTHRKRLGWGEWVKAVITFRRKCKIFREYIDLLACI